MFAVPTPFGSLRWQSVSTFSLPQWWLPRRVDGPEAAQGGCGPARHVERVRPLRVNYGQQRAAPIATNDTVGCREHRRRPSGADSQAMEAGSVRVRPALVTSCRTLAETEGEPRSRP